MKKTYHYDSLKKVYLLGEMKLHDFRHWSKHIFRPKIFIFVLNNVANFFWRRLENIKGILIVVFNLPPDSIILQYFPEMHAHVFRTARIFMTQCCIQGLISRALYYKEVVAQSLLQYMRDISSCLPVE